MNKSFGIKQKSNKETVKFQQKVQAIKCMLNGIS